MRNITALLFAGGLAFFLLVITYQFIFAGAPMLIGSAILGQGANDLGAANLVTSVVLGYRGIDTLGEIAILFTASTATALVLSNIGDTTEYHRPETQGGGDVLLGSANLFFPLLLTLGLYIILHGHLTPGGGFQGGVILATAFFLPILAMPSRAVKHSGLAMVEGFSGAVFILIGLASLFQGEAFMQPFLSKGSFGELFSAGTLPLLYIALGLKVGAELSSLLARLAEIPGQNPDSSPATQNSKANS